MLYQLGAVAFEVQPVNVAAAMIEVGADYAAHDLIGAMRAREFAGPSDLRVRLMGRLLPNRFGMGGFEVLKAMAMSGVPQMMIRGDGVVFGWMDVQRVRERHSYLDASGVGRIVDFDIEMVQSPTGAGAGAVVSLVSSLLAGLTQ